MEDLLHTAIRSLITNTAVWFLVYSFASSLLWALRDVIKHLKLNPEHPPASLIRLEKRRCFQSVLCCCVWDVCLSSLGFVSPVGAGSSVVGTLFSRSFLCKVMLGLFWSDAHFYSIHRLLHTNSYLYKHVHKIHHESVNTNVWSGLSFHPIEGMLYFSTLLAAVFVPLDETEFAFFRTAIILAPIGGHWGYRYDFWNDSIEDLASIDHYVHHVKFNVNYGSGIFKNHFVWDRLFGTSYKGKL